MVAKKPASKDKKEKNVGGAVTPAEPKMVEVEVTQEYLDANPELKDNKIEVGDIIEVTEAEAKAMGKAAEAVTPADKSPKGAVAVLKGNEYVRTYAPDQKDELKEFLSKNSTYTTVPDASIEALEVPYSIKDKTTGAVTRTSRKFENKAEAVAFRNEHRSVCLVATSKKK